MLCDSRNVWAIPSKAADLVQSCAPAWCCEIDASWGNMLNETTSLSEISRQRAAVPLLAAGCVGWCRHERLHRCVDYLHIASVHISPAEHRRHRVHGSPKQQTMTEAYASRHATYQRLSSAKIPSFLVCGIDPSEVRLALHVAAGGQTPVYRPLKELHGTD